MERSEIREPEGGLHPPLSTPYSAPLQRPKHPARTLPEFAVAFGSTISAPREGGLSVA